MAKATGHTQGAIYWHLKEIYRKQSISRQVDLVRLVLSLAEFGDRSDPPIPGDERLRQRRLPR